MVGAKRTKTGNYLVLIQGGLSGKESQNKTICPGAVPTCNASQWESIALWLKMGRKAVGSK